MKLGPHKVGLVILAAVVLSAFIFFMVLPLGRTMVLGSLRPFEAHNLTEAKDYFSVVSVFVAAIIGVLGLLLGYVYYYDRKIHDISLRTLTERLKRLELLVNELKTYDASVRLILRKIVSEKPEIARHRLIIRASYSQMYVMLEVGDPSFELTEQELGSLLALFRFVDNSAPIMEDTIVHPGLTDLADIENSYSGLFNTAFRACHVCMARVNSGTD